MLALVGYRKYLGSYLEQAGQVGRFEPLHIGMAHPAAVLRIDCKRVGKNLSREAIRSLLQKSRQDLNGGRTVGEKRSDARYILKEELTSFHDVWDVACERKESKTTPRFSACPKERMELICVLIEKHAKVLERQGHLDTLRHYY